MQERCNNNTQQTQTNTMKHNGAELINENVNASYMYK